MVRATTKSQENDDDDFGVEALKSEISERIRKTIRESGGNAVVAEKSGVPLRTIGNYTRGLSEPKIVSLSRIAKACGVSLDWIATGEYFKNTNAAPDELDEELMTAVVLEVSKALNLQQVLKDAGFQLPIETIAAAYVATYRAALKEERSN
ncbi:helix-turn-helix transcriptional regulator [Magnetovibrio sp.]|uniref:helix-turn-helix domain-containing protein n=1 Tax=Magnetovibrio sp. TaxID=2024836 RepID=UPI002F94B990